MSKTNFYPLALIAIIFSVICCGCAYESVGDDKNLDPPGWIGIAMYVYIGLVLLAPVLGGAITATKGGDFGNGCVAGCYCWAVGCMVGPGMYWLLLGVNTWFEWLIHKF
jgi:hypothetical protein